jgi:hypothetical protein
MARNSQGSAMNGCAIAENSYPVTVNSQPVAADSRSLAGNSKSIAPKSQDIAAKHFAHFHVFFGSARVPRAANGVAPLASSSHSTHLEQRSLRRDTANHTPESCAPHFPVR